MTITPYGFDNVKTVALPGFSNLQQGQQGIAVTTGQAFIAFPTQPTGGDWIRDDVVFLTGPDYNKEAKQVVDSTIIVYPATFLTIGNEPVGWGVDTATTSFDSSKGQVQITARVVALDHSSAFVRIGFQLTTIYRQF